VTGPSGPLTPAPPPLQVLAPPTVPPLTGAGPRPDAVGGGDGASFEALLAEATARQAGQPVPRLDRPSGDRPWQRPAGALGASSTVAAGHSAAGGALALVQGRVVPAAGPYPRGGPDSIGSVLPLASSAGHAVVSAGARHLGVPYLWGGTDPVRGFDCSGLVQDAYRAIGVDMPKWSRHQATMGAEVSSVEDALPGDVLAFGEPVNHVALYVGDGQMLHAPKTGEVVKIEAIDRPIVTIRRIVSAGGGYSPAIPTAHPGDAERHYASLFESAGRRWNVDPALLSAVARTESGFDPTAVSSAGAQGIMQFMPATAAEMGVDPWDPASAIDGAARFLRKSLDRFGSVDLAIASYNAGPGAVARHGGIPPFAETQHYVRTVLDAWRRP